VLDGLMLGTLPWPAGAREVIDIGSGAGLPGIVLAVLHPECRVVSVERVAKKITFQQVARERLGLDNFLPLRADVRALAGAKPPPDVAGAALPRAFDLAVARAFARLDELLALARVLLVPGGTLWAMKGRRLELEQAQVSQQLRDAFMPEAPVLSYDFPEFGVGGRVVTYRTGLRNF
jgi:16S rRNA (guanine527-N7)-methyltransferase